MIRNLISILLIIGGIFLMLYGALYFMLYLGIIGVIESLDPMNAKGIALNIIRIILCEVGIIPGLLVYWAGCLIKS